MRSKLLNFVVLGVCLFCLFLTAAEAQKYTGTITGTVVDPSGAVVPGAAVKVRNLANGSERSTTTSDQGSYTFPELDPGTYDVSVNKSGFKQSTQQKVELHVSDTRAVDVQMQVGSSGEQVNVEASTVQVETQTGAVSNTITGQQVRELPLNGRNFVQLTTLVPGASVAENFDNKNKGLLGGVDISFSGAPSNANQWTVDGASNNDVGSQRTILIYPSIDGIEEFKILRNSYGPEYSGAGGAQVNIVTRGGGNDFHGSAFYFGRNDKLNAKNYALGQCTPGTPGCNKQLLRRNDFGYTIGGPLKKEKIFFFWSEEWNKERRGAVRSHHVPTAAELTGDFRDLAACPSRLPHDPANGGALFTYNGQTNVIDPARISPAGKAYLSQIAAPNIADPCGINWVGQVKIPLEWREENIRGDWNITKSTSLMLRYTQDAWSNPLHGYSEGGLWGDSDFPAVSDAWTQPGKMAVAKLSTTLGNTAVNDFQFSWSGNRITIAQAGDNPGLIKTITNLSPTLYPASDKLHANNLQEPLFWGGTPDSGLLGQMGPFHNRQDLFTWKDDFSKVMGNHTFKVGGLYSRNAKDEEGGHTESPQYWGATGAPSPWQGTTGTEYGDFLLKGMTFGGSEGKREYVAQIRWRDLEFYTGDTWKATRHLTLELGARWSFIRPEYMDGNDYSSFVPSLYKAALGGDGCNGILYAPQKNNVNPCAAAGFTGGTQSNNRGLVPPNNHLLAPRVGFAWDIFGTQKFVLRGGLGQFFARDPVGEALRIRGNNTPFQVTTGYERTLDGPLVTSGPGQNVFDASTGGSPGQGMENNTNISNSWQWNLTTEAALWKDAKLEVGWVALRGVHLNSSAQVNQIAPANRLAYIQRGLANGGDNRADLFPFGALKTGPLTIWNHRGDSIYHSLQAMFSTKFTRNSIFQSSYTWSKNIATSNLGYVDTVTGVADIYNSRAGRGLANFDRRHVFSASVVYNLPVLESWNPIARSIFGGWEANSIISAASGTALTIKGSANNVGNPWGLGNSGGNDALPIRVKSQPCHLEGSNKLQWINPAAFTWEGFQLGGYPNAGPGQCSGPGIRNVDFAIDKNWNLPSHGFKYFGEKARLQFRLETFNLFNHPMFRSIGSNLNTFAVNGATFTGGVIHGGTYPTLVNGTASNNFGLVQPATNIGNREVQYGLKLIF